MLSVWPLIVEKAFSKVKGNYEMTDGGNLVNGLRMLTGAPVFTYSLRYFVEDDYSSPDNYWEMINESLELNYIISFSTEPNKSSE